MRRVHEEPPSALLALPNLLTLVRVPLGLLMLPAATNTIFAFTVLALAGLSDLLDGWFARAIHRWRAKRGDPGAYGAGTGLGAFLDPLCDKFFVVCTLLALFFVVETPAYLLLLIAGREILMAPVFLIWRLAYKHVPVNFTAGWIGKITTVVQFAAVPLAFLEHELLIPVAWTAAVLGAASVVYYTARAMRVERETR